MMCAGSVLSHRNTAEVHVLLLAKCRHECAKA